MAPNKEHNISDILKSYLQVASEQRNEYHIYNRTVLSKEWISFNQSMANSLSYLYQISIPLYKGIQEQDLKFSYPSSRYYSFYFDFIVSKPSNTIFTETPKKSQLNLFPLTANAIAGEIKKLDSILNDEYGSIDDFYQDFDERFQIFFHRTFLYYDFVFNENEGIFTKSNYNKDLFKVQRDSFLKLINNRNTKFRRLFSKSIILNIQNSYFYQKRKDNPFFKFFKKDITNLDDLNYKIIFRDYVNYQKTHKDNQTKLIKFEIFSYVLANKIWKFDKIYQNRLETISETNEDQAFNEEMKEYITSYFDAVEEYYDDKSSKSDLFRKISELDKTFINDVLYKKYLFDIQNQDSEELKIANTISPLDKSEINLDNIAKAISYAKDVPREEHEKFKFYRVIEKSNINNINALLSQFNSLINKDVQENKHYMGLLRSGAFISHALNIIQNNDDIPLAESMLTHPYFTIMPRTFYKERNKQNQNKIYTVYIDESIKSGYSVDQAHTYRTKFIEAAKNKIESETSELFTMVDFVDFTNKVTKDNIKHKSLFDIRIKNHRLDIKNNYFDTNATLFDWKTFLNAFQPIDETHIYNYGLVTKDICEKLDLTKVISHSKLLFYICKKFADDLHNDIYRDTDIKNIIFYAGSLEGKLLIDTTLFIYKVLYDDKENLAYTYHVNGKSIHSDKFKTMESNTYKKYFFDISLVTGSTCKKILELDVHSKNKSFDRHYVIAKYNTCEIENITSIFTYGEK